MSSPYPEQPRDAPPSSMPPAPGRPPGASGPPNVSRPARPPERKRAVSTGQLLGALLFVVVLVFVLENTRSVKVRLLFPEVKAPLAVALVIAAVLGAAIAW